MSTVALSAPISSTSNAQRRQFRYYEEFIQSVNQLLQVRQKASRLKAMIAGFNEELAEATKPVIAATERLIAMRKVQRNIIATIECMTSTLPIIQLYCKAQAQLNSQRYDSSDFVRWNAWEAYTLADAGTTQL